MAACFFKLKWPKKKPLDLFYVCSFPGCCFPCILCWMCVERELLVEVHPLPVRPSPWSLYCNPLLVKSDIFRWWWRSPASLTKHFWLRTMKPRMHSHLFALSFSTSRMFKLMYFLFCPCTVQRCLRASNAQRELPKVRIRFYIPLRQTYVNGSRYYCQPGNTFTKSQGKEFMVYCVNVSRVENLVLVWHILIRRLSAHTRTRLSTAVRRLCFETKMTPSTKQVRTKCTYFWITCTSLQQSPFIPSPSVSWKDLKWVIHFQQLSKLKILFWKYQRKGSVGIHRPATLPILVSELAHKQMVVGLSNQ